MLLLVPGQYDRILFLSLSLCRGCGFVPFLAFWHCCVGIIRMLSDGRRQTHKVKGA